MEVNDSHVCRDELLHVDVWPLAQCHCAMLPEERRHVGHDHVDVRSRVEEVLQLLIAQAGWLGNPRTGRAPRADTSASAGSSGGAAALGPPSLLARHVRCHAFAQPIWVLRAGGYGGLVAVAPTGGRGPAAANVRGRRRGGSTIWVLRVDGYGASGAVAPTGAAVARKHGQRQGGSISGGLASGRGSHPREVPGTLLTRRGGKGEQRSNG